MHGYKIIANISKNFGVYFGPNTIYPLLGILEEKDYIKSQWDLKSDRLKKVYVLTYKGSNLLNGTEQSLNHIFKRLKNIGFNHLPLMQNNCHIKQIQFKAS